MDATGFRLHSIVVQSPLLKALLCEVFRGYSGVTADLEDVVFKAPFLPFFHRWTEFGEAIESTSDPETAAHACLLHDTLKAEMAETVRKQKDLVSHRVITFEYLWTLFSPGQLLFAYVDGHERFFKLASSDYDGKPASSDYDPPSPRKYKITSKYIEYGGARMGYGSRYFQIDYFKGTRDITEFEVYPASFHPAFDQVKETLYKRGKLYQAYRGFHHKAYKGFIRYDSIMDAPPQSNYMMLPGGMGTIPPPLMPMGIPPPATSSNQEVPNRKWAEFLVTDVKEISWNDHAFGNLVIPSDYKQLVQAFVESQMAHGLKFDDIVDGKGRGLVMLLTGEPGVGKTLTAETLSEHLKAPLYMMSAAELGENTQSVEYTLERILGLATKWNAILLLDECDVFLEQRRDSDLVRNKIVSLFLRYLEYYSGILILTTNRLHSFDDAFKSRIHITLHYPRLDSSAREHIWRNFHNLSRYESALTDTDFKRLAEEEMNGREIKNAMKAAQLLACSRKEAIGLGHVQSVLRATMGKSMTVICV
ncbi:P-loop containing nucleoside triphosphate hydrolase protein [Rhizodiscina lignyota]|uniref:P-loop containing nucleoside triphosphate hydrolase protein n=1 Tax=Rhizodiscina lignyota TaxID=1504668 RepID=A0A9P4M6M1_9PEZI|nr:P-loop containing nucleoside triphosphate hydrolase protein [Rhizodiscina lignyota]